VRPLPSPGARPACPHLRPASTPASPAPTKLPPARPRIRGPRDLSSAVQPSIRPGTHPAPSPRTPKPPSIQISAAGTTVSRDKAAGRPAVQTPPVQLAGAEIRASPGDAPSVQIRSPPAQRISVTREKRCLAELLHRSARISTHGWLIRSNDDHLSLRNRRGRQSRPRSHNRLTYERGCRT
jgi:hypothetical protein